MSGETTRQQILEAWDMTEPQWEVFSKDVERKIKSGVKKSVDVDILIYDAIMVDMKNMAEGRSVHVPSFQNGGEE